MSPAKPRAPRPDPDGIARLIRMRRSELDWSLAKLARAANLRSPAYVFHIENGTKTPSEPVARRLAKALALDPELLAAWARARGRADLATALDASETLRRWLGEADIAPDVTPDTGREPDWLAVPVLPEGADPAAGPIPARAIETLHLARALFPPLAADPRLVGYRVSAHGARRMSESLHAGDCVVVLLGAEPPGPNAPCAVRTGGRVELARVHVRAGAVHLPAAAGGNDSEPSDTRIGPLDGDTIVGRVVLAFRRWL